jgi:hypothetical protein
MKIKKYLFIPLLLAILFSTFFAGVLVKPAFAQDRCVDATGAPIPCPPTKDKNSNGGGNNDNNKRPTATPVPPTATPTNIPLPISAAPTSLPDENYLGSCSNADENVFDCFEKFKCEDGLLVMKVDLYTGNGTKYDFYCIPDETVPQLNLPLTIPDPVGKDANWTGGCPAGDGLDACLDLASRDCSEEGGEISIWYDDDGAGVYCQNQSEDGQPASEATNMTLGNPTSEVMVAKEDWHKFCSNSDKHAYATCLVDTSSACAKEGGTASPTTHEDGATVNCSFSKIMMEATPLPLVSVPQDGTRSGEDWDESCSWASCFAYDIMCWADGGSGYGQEDGAGNTVYHCDMPEGSTSSNNLKQLGLATIVVVLVGLLVPAIQKVRDAAAKPQGSSARMPNNKNPELVKNQEDGGTEKATLYGRKAGDDKRQD